MTNKYELLYILSSQYTEDEVPPLAEKVNKMLEKYGAKITKGENLGKKKLAYPIKKFYQGYYMLNEFELEGKNVDSLSTQLKLSDEILRHIIVKNPPKMEIRPLLAKKKIEAPKIQENTVETDKIKKEDETEKIKLEDLDKKLDEILDTDNLL